MRCSEKVAEFEKLHAEVKIREREEVRSQLESDYESDEEREDVTRPRITNRPRSTFQDISRQQEKMQDILKHMSKNQTVNPVSSIRESENKAKRIGYQPPCTPVREESSPAHCSVEHTAGRNVHGTVLNQRANETAQQIHGQSSMALFSRALRENRLPTPKILTFDGDPKKYKMFIASFRSNVEEMLDEDDNKMKLTLLLQHCKDKALDLINDCVMLPPEEGYNKVSFSPHFFLNCKS